jgi:hypothetical protein
MMVSKQANRKNIRHHHHHHHHLPSLHHHPRRRHPRRRHHPRCRHHLRRRHHHHHRQQQIRAPTRLTVFATLFGQRSSDNKAMKLPDSKLP